MYWCRRSWFRRFTLRVDSSHCARQNPQQLCEGYILGRSWARSQIVLGPPLLVDSVLPTLRSPSPDRSYPLHSAPPPLCGSPAVKVADSPLRQPFGPINRGELGQLLDLVTAAHVRDKLQGLSGIQTCSRFSLKETFHHDRQTNHPIFIRMCKSTSYDRN